MKIGIACGGTGGHLFPGLACAAVLRGRGHEVTLWLAGRPGEAEALAGWGGAAHTVPSRGLSSRAPWAIARAAWRMAAAARRCRALMARSVPDVLLAMGSYASVGPAVAARALRVPVVLHEANVVPGRAVRWLSRSADAVALGFDETRSRLAHGRLVTTGMPLRRAAPEAAPDAAWSALDPAAFTVLVMGGSGGARRLNRLALEAILRLRADGQALQAIHLAGRQDEPDLRRAYREAGVPAAVFGFLNDMPRAYRLASLAVCRSGASTCAELAEQGVPALLVPYPFAAGRHQSANAAAVAAAGAAAWREEAGLTADWLAGFILGLMRDPERLAAMRAAAVRRRTSDPAERLADLVEAVGRENAAVRGGRAS